MKKKLCILFSFFSISFGFCNTPIILPFQTDQTYLSPMIKMNDNGYCVRVWGHAIKPDSIYESLQAGISSNYGETWKIETIDEPNYSELGIEPFVVLNETNHSIVVWQRWYYNNNLNKYVYQVKATPYGITPISIQTLDENSTDESQNAPKPVLGMDNTGHAIVLWNWKNPDDNKFYPKKARSSDNGVTWQDINYFEDIIPIPSDKGINIQLAMDKLGTGKAVAVWVIHTIGAGYFTRVARTDDFGKTWKDLQTMDQTPSSDEESVEKPSPKIEIDDKGNTDINWTQNTDGEDFNRKVFSPDFGESWPLNISYNKEEIHTFFQTQLRNKIIVYAINQPGTFKIYKDSTLTYLLDSKFKNNEFVIFYEHNVKKGPYTYYITWTDQNGEVTGPVSITIDD